MGHLSDRMAEDLRLAGYSRSTGRIYLHYARNFVKHFMRPPTEMGEREVRTFLLHLLDTRKLSHEAYRQCHAALRFLYTVTLRRGFEVKWIPPKRAGYKKLPVVLSGCEVLQLFDGFESLKYRTLAMVMYGAGLRVQEASHLRVSDIDSQRMLLHVREGKGGKDRYVMLSEQLLGTLRRYWLEYRPRGFLFPGRTGDKPIEETAIRKTMRLASAKAGLRKRVTPHVLRHSFATHLLELGNDTRVIQVLLGHHDIKVTSRYTRVSTRHIQGIKSPLDLLSTPRGVVLG
jgi:integrase/recombinase XerD